MDNIGKKLNIQICVCDTALYCILIQVKMLFITLTNVLYNDRKWDTWFDMLDSTNILRKKVCENTI
jgi:hypothetical protein